MYGIRHAPQRPATENRESMLRLTLPLLLALLAPLHTRLAQSEPAAQSTVAESPAQLRLWFEGDIEPAFTQLSLRASNGARLALGAPHEGGEAGLIVAAVPLRLAPDAYTVGWQTVGRDGHTISGEFGFTVAGADTVTAQRPATIDSSAWGAGAAGRTVAGPPVVHTDLHGASSGAHTPQPFSLRAVRWVELTLLVLALGAIAVLLLVLRTAHGSPAHERFLAAATRRVRMLATGAAALYLVTALGRFALESVQMHGGTAGLSGSGLSQTLNTGWGRAWLIGLLAVAGALVALLLRPRPASPDALHRPTPGSDLALGATALIAAVAPALTGHAAGAEAMMPLAVLSDWLHVVGAAAWMGGVATLALAGAPAALAQPVEDRAPSMAWLVSAFHALAVPAIALVGASGVLSAWLRVGSWEALTRTNYGDLVLFKVYVVAFAALMGAFHWLRVHPRLAAATRGDDREARRMSWTLYVELIAGVLALALTAALVTTPPPR